jgi:branched-chain amino acid transport system permease protein
LIIILFSPGGIANIIVLHKPILEKKLVKEIVPSYSFFIVSLLIFLFGFIGLIEMLYKMEGLASGALVNIFGFKVNPFSIIPWIIFSIATIFGAFSLRKTYFNILVVWKNLRVKLQS